MDDQISSGTVRQGAALPDSGTLDRRCPVSGGRSDAGGRVDSRLPPQVHQTATAPDATARGDNPQSNQHMPDRYTPRSSAAMIREKPFIHRDSGDNSGILATKFRGAEHGASTPAGNLPAGAERCLGRTSDAGERAGDERDTEARAGAAAAAARPAAAGAGAGRRPGRRLTCEVCGGTGLNAHFLGRCRHCADALADAIEAGDVDADGEAIPYPKYHGV